MKSTNEDLFQKFLDYIASNPLKGECLLIVAGASENDKEENLTSNVYPGRGCRSFNCLWNET